MIKREKYLKRLRDLRDTDLIKVVTGMRRVGKSTLLAEFRRELRREKISAARIQSYNLEQAKNRKFLQDPFLLHDLITKNLKKGVKNYIFIDEVQLLPEFERLVDSLYTNKDIDLYITGSNSYIASSELATLLSGRYLEIEVFPLSFSEYLDFFPSTSDRLRLFENYLRFGALPEVANLLATEKTSEIRPYLEMIYNTIIEKDIKQRLNLAATTDFRNVSLFCFDNIGNITSPNAIAKATNLSRPTVNEYLEALENCFVFYKTTRFDIRGKKLLSTLEKYYTADLGLANTLLGKFDDADMGHRLENLVYLELRRRYNQVWVGKNYEKEIDFVVRNNKGQTEYYQVALSVADEKTRTREVAALKNTGDFYQKTILTMDLFSTYESGIARTNLLDWLDND